MFSTEKTGLMLISKKSSEELSSRLSSYDEIYCSGLFLSAKWFVFSSVAHKGLHVIVMPSKETAEYCVSDLYNLIEGDRVFFLPDTGKSLERSNYKSTVSVQRTSSISEISGYRGEDLLVVVTYPSALEEKIPGSKAISDSLLRLETGQEISHERITELLLKENFERVDFVSAPGQFAVRGGIIDIFSYSFNNPYRISFFGDEIDGINIFDCNTQLSKEKVGSVDIYPDLGSDNGTEQEGVYVSSLLPENSVIWFDSADMYSNEPFFSGFSSFRKVYLEVPLSVRDADPVRFNISPQPSFNKNFELLTEDIRTRLESGYKVYIYGEKESQLDRLKSILSRNDGILPRFCPEKNIHNGFIDNDDRICCYTDHEIFDRYHRV